MKRTLTTSIFLCLSYMNVMTARPITIPYSFPEERVNAFSEANDDWALLGEVTTTAQNQDPWVGTWTSEIYKALDRESGGGIYTLFRYVIRISKNGDNYFVRAKTIKDADPKSASYDDASNIKHTQAKLDGNRMLLVSHRNKLPFYVNGRIESYSNTTSYFELTTNNGVLHCSFYKYVIEHYNKDMKYESTDTFSLHDQYPGPCVERDLFNDDW